ncbi:hypothetical protein AVEN_157069-1 [Araneus ventricosus]|uniref:Uncharacterized protein n=1 Tax=Araneus ventricosus TaxID=182803 RepID=A0A4Y2GP49_ARAVE|nr:hypothetical protein AVEN_157069-1 [Araneus ventricosus]
MESSSTFKRISSANRDIEKFPAPLRSHISLSKSPIIDTTFSFLVLVTATTEAPSHRAFYGLHPKYLSLPFCIWVPDRRSTAEWSFYFSLGSSFP